MDLQKTWRLSERQSRHPESHQHDYRISDFYNHTWIPHQFWQPPTDEGSLVEVWESSREVKAFGLSTKIEDRHIKEDMKTSLLWNQPNLELLLGCDLKPPPDRGEPHLWNHPTSTMLRFMPIHILGPLWVRSSHGPSSNSELHFRPYASFRAPVSHLERLTVGLDSGEADQAGEVMSVENTMITWEGFAARDQQPLSGGCGHSCRVWLSPLVHLHLTNLCGK